MDSLDGVLPPTEVQSVYSIVPVNRANKKNVFDKTKVLIGQFYGISTIVGHLIYIY